MDHRKMGREARHKGSAFESLIKATFTYYRNKDLAHLDFMPIPTYPAGIHPKYKRMTYMATGKSPFDIYGFCGKAAGMLNGGVFIGAELKATTATKRLIVEWPTDKHASRGLKFHQLEALYHVACSGGLARLVWCNDGEIRVLDNAGIQEVYEITIHAINSRNAGKASKSGTKSISWDALKEPEDIGGMPNWLMI